MLLDGPDGRQIQALAIKDEHLLGRFLRRTRLCRRRTGPPHQDHDAEDYETGVAEQRFDAAG